MTAVPLFFFLAVLSGVADTLPVLLAALVHECGHLVACRFYGVPVRLFAPSPVGAVIGYDATCLTYGQEAAIAAAGPLANALSVLCVLFCRGRFFALFGVSSLGLCFFNLLPLTGLDGGVILRTFLDSRFGPRKAFRVAGVVSDMVAAALFVLAALFQLRAGGNLSLLFLSIYLLLFRR